MNNTSSQPSRLGSLPVDDFLTALASDQPAPGSGSAAALAGAMGCALVTMVAGLTVGRQRYAPVQQELIGLRDQAVALQHNLIDMLEVDAAAYNRVMVAYRLPKESPHQRDHRSAAIQDALRGAIDVPLDIAAACVDVVGLAGQVAAQGNRNAACDAACAALLADAGLQSAARNIRFNLQGLSDAHFCAVADLRVAQLLTAGQAALAEALAAADAAASVGD